MTDFYEEDEPVENIQRAFEEGEPGLTAPEPPSEIVATMIRRGVFNEPSHRWKHPNSDEDREAAGDLLARLRACGWTLSYDWADDDRLSAEEVRARFNAAFAAGEPVKVVGPRVAAWSHCALTMTMHPLSATISHPPKCAMCHEPMTPVFANTG